MADQNTTSLWDALKEKAKKAVEPYQMGSPTNKVHQIYTQNQPKPTKE